MQGCGCEGVPVPMCAAGTERFDADGDRCKESCRAVSCPPFAPTCERGTRPADTDGDGCVDGCR